jgi:protocatechuate 3,4-dioxygenase beta subunit
VTSQFARDASAVLGTGLAGLRDRRGVLLGLGGTALLAGAVGKGRESPAACLLTPAETRGPFPADGTRGPNALALTGIERSDIRGGFAGMTGTAEGVPLDLTISLVGAAGRCAPLPGWGLYLWHNDARGGYSLYSVPETNYLRGLQQSGADGTVRFRTILPGCYGGRAPHMHFEAFSSAAAAVAGQSALLASQFALPEDRCRAVYARDSRYGDSLANLDAWPTARDFVFSDADAGELALQSIALEGDAATGFRGRARVALDA